MKINGDIDEILKMPDSEKAYWALCRPILEEEHGDASPEVFRILSLGDFLDNCLTNGFGTFDCNGRWSIVPAAELMDAIGEPMFAKELWACIGICRDYGKKIGRDPFDPDVEYVSLNEETENKISTREFDFTNHCDLETTGRLFRKTMDYARANRKLFTK